MVEGPLAEVEAAETTTRLVQAEGVAGTFRYPDGLLAIADPVVELAQFCQGLDEALTEGRGGERGPEACLRWELAEAGERLSEDRDRCLIRPQMVVRITQVELDGHPQCHIRVDQREGPLA